MNKVHFDMETADPDDVFTICFLVHHSNIELTSVTVTPGSRHQIGLVKKVLNQCGVDVPIGSRVADYEKEAVSGFLKKWISFEPTERNASSDEIMSDAFANGATLLTGAPLKNLHNYLKNDNCQTIDKWIAQGGFAGDNVVPKELRLEKFDGMTTCPTFNFNGDPKGALLALSSDKIKKRMLVSKNVCHGVAYDAQLHEFVREFKDKSAAINMMYEGMDLYLKKKKQKIFHDPLAATVLVDDSVCNFVEVEPYREKGKWGCRIANDTNTFISIDVDKDKFKRILVDA